MLGKLIVGYKIPLYHTLASILAGGARSRTIRKF